MRKEEMKSLAIGAGSGVVASFCCTLPLILILLGIGSVTTALKVSMYKTYFFALSLVLVALALGFQLKRNPSCCTPGGRTRFVIIALSAYILIYIVLLYAVVPAVAPYVYGGFL
jgi:hypothetical protein